ncbi:hypothetical protein FOMA001_g15743 [Fusarium oxysporum f. sp. matthiolae]|nr:hypothetical protein FOMA001_g15743 [Fusarium oxysporum f. sp. matthiolae]
MVPAWKKSTYHSTEKARLSIFVWEFFKEAKFFFIFTT